MSGAQRFWRIATQGPSWRADDFSGNVSTGDPGRWNSHGVPVVYCSTSLALCSLEALVHIGGCAFFDRAGGEQSADQSQAPCLRPVAGHDHSALDLRQQDAMSLLLVVRAIQDRLNPYRN